MTRFWLWGVNTAIKRHPELDFDRLLEAEPHLLDKSLPFNHWSRDRMAATDARSVWVQPDLRPLPHEA
jgi:hypothetical protein